MSIIDECDRLRHEARAEHHATVTDRIMCDLYGWDVRLPEPLDAEEWNARQLRALRRDAYLRQCDEEVGR